MDRFVASLLAMTAEGSCAPSSSLRAQAKQSTSLVTFGVIPAKAGIQYAAASRLIISACGICHHPLSRMMTRECVAADFQTADRILAAWCARVMHECFAQRERAWGMPGAQCTRSLACKIKKHTR